MSKYSRVGQSNGRWLGDDVSVRAVHFWVRKHFVKTGTCEHCEATDRVTEWARKDHGERSRDRERWLELCKKCHTVFDKRNPNPKGALRSPEVRARIAAGMRASHARRREEAVT